MGLFVTDTRDAPLTRQAPERHCLVGENIPARHRNARGIPVRPPTPLRGPIRIAISGYRFYSPDLGRWVSRDPIEEQGGLNVYGYVRNAGVLWVDLHGLQIFYYVDREYLRDIAERNYGDRSDENLRRVAGMMGRAIGQHNESVARTGQEDLHLSGRIFNDLAQLRSFIGDVQGAGHHFIIHAHGEVDIDTETGLILRRIGLVVGGRTYPWESNELDQLWRMLRGRCATITLRVCGVSQETAARIKETAQAEAVYYDPEVNLMRIGVGQFGLNPVWGDDPWGNPIRYEYDPTSTGPLQRE